MRRPFQRFWSKVKLSIANPISPQDVSAASLQSQVLQMLNHAEEENGSDFKESRS